MSRTYRIAPSILSADFARLGEEVRHVLAAGADWIHFDVMDNHYVPNLTFGPMVCQALKPHTARPDGSFAPIDVHLMVQPVDALAQAFAQAGASLISFHPEASAHPHRSVQAIKAAGCQAGLVFNPATPLDVLDWLIDEIDLILIMSVNPGFGGQSFIDSALRKIEAARRRIDASGRDIRLEVDGGIKPANIRRAADAGADTFVAGSAIFGQPDYAAVIADMRAALAPAPAPEQAPESTPEKAPLSIAKKRQHTSAKGQLDTSKKAPITACMIDLDGTLVDTMGDFAAALNLMLADLSLPPVAPAFIQHTVGKGSEHLIRSVLAEQLRQSAAPANVTVDMLYPNAWASYQRHYLAHNGQHSRVYPGVQEGLQALRDLGLPLACLTNKPLAFTQPLLAAKGLQGYFSHVFGGDSFARKKPDPLPLLQTCRALGSEPARTLMVGDSENDARAARAAGCPVALLSYGYNHGQPITRVDADAHLDSLTQLAPWLIAQRA